MTGQADKIALRREMLARRAALHSANPLAGHVLSAHLPRLDGPAGIVAGYRPMRGEIDPSPLMTRFRAAGWRTALPVTPAKDSQSPLAFRLWSPGEPLIRHAYGMEEPAEAADQVRPDLLLVPLLAFDDQGHRLGYGAGHYDRTLAVLGDLGPLRAIGLAFEGQRVADLPAEPHDQPLDAILTERGYREFANRLE